MADQDTEELVLKPKIISPASIGVGILVVFSYLTKATYTTNPYLVFGFAAVLALFSLSHFIPRLKFGKAHAFYVYTYTWILAFMLIFVVPTLSLYLFLWVMLLYLSEYFYQLKGTIISLLSLLVTMVMGSLYQLNGLSTKTILSIAFHYTLLVIISQVISRIAFGDRQTRLDMSKKIVKAEYEHGRLVALINSMSDAVIATDENGRILTYNAAALDLLDTNATLSDLYISDVLHLQDADGKPVDSLKLGEKTNYVQHRMDLSIPISKDDKIDLDINISRISRSTILAKQQGYTYLLRDITKQKSLDEEKDLFISEVSHELRTPITIAEGNMSMAVLLTEKPNVNILEVKDSVKKAHEQVVFLADMVNDLSALSRASREDKDMDIETFKVSDVMKELEEQYRPQAEKKKLYLKLELDNNLPNLTTSRLYFKEIMQNFITNAIKYTAQGGLTVKAAKLNNDSIIVGVKDTGAGISKSDQTKVYQKFWRSEDPYTRATSGTGLGLFITAKLAHRLGAELKLDSKIKEGSTFSIILPIVASQAVDQKNVVKSEVANVFN